MYSAFIFNNKATRLAYCRKYGEIQILFLHEENNINFGL